MIGEMTMHNPPHPGELLKEDYIDPLLENRAGINLERIAGNLGIDLQTLTDIIQLRSGINADIALRLEKAFPNTTAGYWIKLQNMYDLWLAKQNFDMENIVSYPAEKIYTASI